MRSAVYLVFRPEAFVRQQDRAMLQVRVEPSGEVLWVCNSPVVCPKQATELINRYRLANTLWTDQNNPNFAALIGKLNGTCHQPDQVVVVIAIAQTNVIAQVLEIRHMVASLNRCHRKANPQIQLAADDVGISVGRVRQAFILAALPLIPPPVAKRLGDSFSLGPACFIPIFIFGLSLYLIAVPIL